MRHIHTLSQRPAQAQEPTIGQILAIIGQVLGIIGAALVAKEQGASGA